MNSVNGNGTPLTNGNATVYTRNSRATDLDLLNCADYSYEDLQESADFVYAKTTLRPTIGIICGSGMGPVADSLSDAVRIPYDDIPHFPVATVDGHEGKLVIGRLDDVPVLCMQGRFHHYEGYPLWKCSLPVRVMKLLGITHLVATNAAGGLHEDYRVGDIMIIRDHVNLMGFAGNNPLQGPNDCRFGPRFPPMNKAYDVELIRAARKVAAEMNISDQVHEGVYTCLGGPNFETVAELYALSVLGVDAVGMSTVHEVITARHADMTVFAFSLITNRCIKTYRTHEEANHEEVMDVGKVMQSTLTEFVRRMVGAITARLVDSNTKRASVIESDDSSEGKRRK